MATTEKDKAAQAKKRAASKKAADKQTATIREEAARNDSLREARAQSQINQPAKVKPDPQGDIDQRMAALLKDHQDMGARPK
jgi:hypothetical protein